MSELVEFSGIPGTHPNWTFETLDVCKNCHILFIVLIRLYRRSLLCPRRVVQQQSKDRPVFCPQIYMKI